MTTRINGTRLPKNIVFVGTVKNHKGGTLFVPAPSGEDLIRQFFEGAINEDQLKWYSKYTDLDNRGRVLVSLMLKLTGDLRPVVKDFHPPGFVETVYRLLCDHALLQNEDLQEGLKQVRRGQVKVLLPAS